VAVFDTAYHQTMPPKAFMYGLPRELYTQHSIRRYGFHGTSHQYLAQQAAAMLVKPLEQLNAISCHLGNGSSVAAIRGGCSVDTSMGMTPLEGYGFHGTSHQYLAQQAAAMLGKPLEQLNAISCHLGNGSSVAAIRGGCSVDTSMGMTPLEGVRKYLGAYLAALDGQADALIFSAGIGENSSIVRRLVCAGLQGMGIELDDGKNRAAVGGKDGDIASSASRLRVLVIPTDEELAIAQQTLAVVNRRIEE
ncbi:acetokinase, partial [Haematococcus lacustris]